ncbi:MAG TPA: AbrB/MazE/SpoVT family DNA-binding domain-containing protein [Bradyrhizobium sp.]
MQIGNSVGIILPKEVLAAMDAKKGDELTVTSAPDGFRATPYDEEVNRQIEAGREFMRDYRDTLKALAK